MYYNDWDYQVINVVIGYPEYTLNNMGSGWAERRMEEWCRLKEQNSIAAMLKNDRYEYT